jgi:hypothetical protein
MSTTPTRDEKLTHNLGLYRERWDVVHNADPTIPLLHPDLFAIALDEAMSKRAPYSWLRQAPTFRTRPLGSLLLRLHRWHGGNGQLDSRMIALWDARHLVNGGPDRIRDYYPEHIARFYYGEDAGTRFFEALDNAVLLMRSGRSPATDAWQHALGVVPV